MGNWRGPQQMPRKEALHVTIRRYDSKENINPILIILIPRSVVRATRDSLAKF